MLVKIQMEVNFYNSQRNPWLDGKHTVFGKVVEGLNVVDSIQQNDTIIM